MTPPYEVFQYSIEKLTQLLCEGSHQGSCNFSAKAHRNYFENYFDKLRAKTIIVEHGYIDRDYLDDYSSYYVRCFTGYDRKCTRLHFFNLEISSDEFDSIISSPHRSRKPDLENSYLGFVVVKPLPRTVVGRTCLRTYSEEDGRRFPITRDYGANLFGISLNVKSLAFQEQDSVAAACATSALWSIFNATGPLFHHPIPSPVEITKAATAHLPTQSRIFPNEGLSVEQMAHAIQHVGLEPYLVTVEDEYILKSTIYAFTEAGLPLALGLALVDVSLQQPKVLGLHAVAVTGYRCDGAEPVPPRGSRFMPKASRIDRIYVHDDQVGPFARMEFDGEKITIADSTGTPKEYLSLSTSFRTNEGKIGFVRAIPNVLLVPLYHKIRIQPRKIERLLIDADAVLESYFPNGINENKSKLEWEMKLSRINAFKTEILENTGITPERKFFLLTKPMPKFLWRAVAILSEVPVLELIFDATDIEQGGIFITGIIYNDAVGDKLKVVLSHPEIMKRYMHQQSKEILKWIAIAK